MNKLVLHVARDLALLPLIAILVYQFVVHLPVRNDVETKRAVPSAVQQELEDRLCFREWDGFLCPWRDLIEGRPLAGDADSDLYDGPMIFGALLGSLRIGLFALVVALVGGCLFALLWARVGRGLLSGPLELVPAIVYATPTFLLALLVASFTGVSFDDNKRPFEWVASLVMSVGPGTFIAVVLRDALVAESEKGYFQAAIAKGRSRFDALWRHALPNALPTLLDALPPVATTLLAGSFVVERLFNVTYLGFLYVEAARQKQLGVVVVTTTIFAALLMLVSLVVEVARLVIDPRALARLREMLK